MLNQEQKQRPGLGGALLAAYGVVPEGRELRFSRSLSQLVSELLRQARSMWTGRTRTSANRDQPLAR